MYRTLVFAAPFWLAGLTGALAQEQLNAAYDCDRARDPAAMIKACTKVIHFGNFDIHLLAAAHHNRGVAYYRQGQYLLAIQDYDQALADVPDDEHTFFARGSAYDKLGQTQRALQDLDHVIALKPDFETALIYRCWIRAKMGRDLELGLADCNKYLALKPTDADGLNSRGFVEYRMGRYGDAISDYDSALAKDPKDASSLFVRGLAKRKLGQTADGDKDIADANAIDPKVAETYAGYGVTP